MVYHCIAIDESIRFLDSSSSFEFSGECSLHKWNGAWWHMAAIHEMGMAI